jgi:hypothetical protein
MKITIFGSIVVQIKAVQFQMQNGIRRDLVQHP